MSWGEYKFKNSQPIQSVEYREKIRSCSLDGRVLILPIFEITIKYVPTHKYGLRLR